MVTIAVSQRGALLKGVVPWSMAAPGCTSHTGWCQALLEKICLLMCRKWSMVAYRCDFLLNLEIKYAERFLLTRKKSIKEPLLRGCGVGGSNPEPA